MDDSRFKNLQGKRLLLVEDDEFVRDATVRIFSLYGIEIVTAEDSEGAVKAFFKNGFDFALIDVNIPGGGGVGVYQQIRAEYADFPVVLISGDLDSELAIKFKEDRYLSFAHKPYDPLEMANRLAIISD